MSILECIPLKATDDMLIHSIIHIDNSQSLLSPYPTRKGINQAATSWTTKLSCWVRVQIPPGIAWTSPLSLKPWKMFARWHPHIPIGMNDVYPELPRCKPNFSLFWDRENQVLDTSHIGTLQFAACSVLAMRATSHQAVKPNLCIQVWVCMDWDSGKAEQYKNSTLD